MSHADMGVTVWSDPRDGDGPVRWATCHLQERKAAAEHLETGMD